MPLSRRLLDVVARSVIVALEEGQPPIPDGNPPVNITEAQKEAFQARRLFSIDSHAETTLVFAFVTSCLLALLVMALFFIARPFVQSIYMLRARTGETVYAPEKWIRNMFLISPTEAFSAGTSMDGCMHILAWTMAARMFLWLLLISPLPCCINWFGAGYPCPDGMKSDVSDSYYIVTSGSNTTYVNCGPGKDYHGSTLDNFARLSMTGFQLNNKLVWGHVVTLWLLTFIVVREVKRANNVFTSLRHQWLARRPKALALSVMVVNVTARTDKEFRDMFERCFPGKVVDAKLVKFCAPLSKTCEELEHLESLVEETSPEAENRPDDVETHLIDSNNLIARLNRIRGLDVPSEIVRLREKKKQLQDEIFALCPLVPQESRPGVSTQGLTANLTRLATAVRCEDTVYSTVGFATFTDRRSATQAAQTIYTSNPKKWIVSPAPEPSDLLWHQMASNPRSTNQKVRHLVVIGTAIIFLCWSTVIGLLQELAAHVVEKTFEDSKNISAILTPVAKSFVLTGFLSLLPKILTFLLISSGRMVKSVVYLELQSLLVMFDIIFVVYVTSIAEPIREFLQLIIAGKFSVDAFSFSNTFGTSVPSQFPTLFTFATQNFLELSTGLLQVKFYIGVALNFFILRNLWERSWILARKSSRDDDENPRRFAMLTLMVAIGLMIYQVFPLNSGLFLTLSALGGIAYRYRVLYIDFDLVDSGGLFWSQYEIHVLYVLIAVQITACVVLSSIIDMNLLFAVCTLPLPIGSFMVLRRLEQIRWEFLPALHSEDADVDDDELRFAYVQPQLIPHGDENPNLYVGVSFDTENQLADERSSQHSKPHV